MTVRGLLLALALLASQPVEAAACHRYSIWHYQQPQRCVVARTGKIAHSFARPISPIVATPDKLPNFGIDMPLPGLARADCDGGEADEASRARLLLRAALEAPDAH